MNATDPSYRRLPGRGISWAGLATVWQAEDHLLEVNSMILHERYRRFFLPDISAIIIRRTKARWYWGVAHGIIGIGGGLLAGGLWYWGRSSASEEIRIPLWILATMITPLAVPALILFFLNLILGPTCRCHLKTTAGWRVLSAPSRLRPARRFLARVAPLLAATQPAPTPTEEAGSLS